MRIKKNKTGSSAFEIARLFGWGHCWLPAVSLADKAVCFVALKTAIFYIMTRWTGVGGRVTGGFSISAGNLSLIFLLFIKIQRDRGESPLHPDLSSRSQGC